MRKLARWLRDADKRVLTRTLDAPDPVWPNTTLVRDLEELRALREAPGKDLFVAGGIGIADALARAGLLDELWLHVNPAVIGDGQAAALRRRSTCACWRPARWSPASLCCTTRSSTRRRADGPVRGSDLREGAPGGRSRPTSCAGTWSCPTGSPSAAAAWSPGLALEPEATATAIRGDVLTDGPFIETKEALGGIYILEARDLDHALALAGMTPIVDGGVEVRPLIDFVVVEAP